jgi:hypothetical protein
MSGLGRRHGNTSKPGKMVADELRNIRWTVAFPCYTYAANNL